MGLEAGTYINSLNASWPLGASDLKQQGDDHIRLIKSTLLATFAAITGAVTATHTELNYLAGATGVTGTGNTVRSASPTFTGTLNGAAGAFSGGITAASFTGVGTALTALNASNLGSGTVPDARLSAAVPIINTAMAAVDGGNAGDPGYLGAPVIASGTRNSAATDAGKLNTLLSGETFTIVHGNHPDGAWILFFCASGSATIAISGANLYWAGTAFASSGSRTLAAGGMAFAIRYGAHWIIQGAGLT